MHSGKKLTKEDTWRPADLKRYIRVEEHGDNVTRHDVNERRHRRGESRERQHRDSEKEFRRQRDKEQESTREQDSTRDRHTEDKTGKYVDKRKEGSRDRRGDKQQDGRDRERRRDRERPLDINKYNDNYREIRESRRDREEIQDRDRDKERQREKEKERVRNRDSEGDRDRRRGERDKERRKEERHREHRTERNRHEEHGELGREKTGKYGSEQRDGHRERERKEERTNEKERRERHGDRKHSEGMGQREYKEEHRKHKEERERRHKERGHEEKQKHDRESREHRDSKRPVEEGRHHRGDGERAERDKHKERRHREEDDHERKQRERRQRLEEQEPERNHRDTTSSSDKSHMQETNTVETEVALEEDLGEQDYEDDFEDYEEDFEEIDESEDEGGDEKETEFSQAEEREELTPQRRKEIEAIQRAMEEENERVGTAQSRQNTSREEEEEDGLRKSKAPEKDQSTGSQRGKFIDFVAAKQREVSKKVATKQKKRSTELLHLIDLDFSMTFSLLDLPPVNEYDMYIRNFGSANTKQAYVQCNEDNTDRDIQTEEIEMSEKWTQHPPEHSGACGDPNLSHEARDTSELNFDSQRLTAFLSSASQVMVVLLEEDQAERKSLRKLGTQTDKLSFSKGSLQLNTKLPFLSGRNIHIVHLSQVQRHTMMSVHAPTTQPSAVHLDSCTIICIWNIWEPSRPQKILVYESEIQCCCFSTGKATLVFAGTSVGSVVLWDLREPASNHYRIKIGEHEWTFREPTFSTDAVMADVGHFSAVTSVEVVSSSTAGGLRPEVPLAASEEELSGLSFQLASLDESGVINFWVVVDLPKANEAGSPTDLGLRPGSKVKLLHSSSLLSVDRVSPRDPVKTGPLQTAHLKFLPTDSNHFFIGTNMGLVSHGTSHGLKAPPKFYRFQEPGPRPVDVTSIQFSPFKQDMFLVGCGDGSVRLHGVILEQPVAEWKSRTGEPVMLVQWAQTRPTVFCVLDAASTVHIWDLLKNETEPVVTERIAVDRVTAMDVFGDSGQKNMYSGLALAHESGKLEMHYFTSDFTVPLVAEGEKLESMMAEAL